jgi:mannose-1-phosphate guanylyltransferase / mannose-6-phosphate isomerase
VRSGDSIYAAVLAGGSGQRFWPLSRELSPKQMLSVFGTESLIAQAVHRVDGFAMPEKICIVTSARLFDELRNHLTAQPDPTLRHVRYLQEPLARNTAPAIAYAAAVFEREDPDAVMIVLPSDHLLKTGSLWAECLQSAIALARDDYLVTIGIEPTRPETAYGYIEAGPELEEYVTGRARPRKAARFVEKPDLERATEYAASGSYHWNAGIFVMRAARVLEELEAHPDTGTIPEVVRWLAAAQAAGSLDPAAAYARFESLPSISIDYAVMERADRVAVIPASLEWSDVGSLLALADVAEPDAAGNVRVGRGVDLESRDSIVYSTDRLVATLGVEDLMVIDTVDATLVAPKERAQDVRLVVEALAVIGAEEVVHSKTSLRPWGSWTTLLEGPGYKIKRVEVSPGHRLSLQSHTQRSEHWVVVSGTAWVNCDDREFDLCENKSAYIPVGSVHRLENRGAEPLVIIEVQVGEYVGEDDIVRIEDDWSRHG